MIEHKYGGFYIGRYATGNISKNFPVVQKGNIDIVSQTWYEMYGKMEAMAIHESVKSNIIWGCLWDETLQWLVDTGSSEYTNVKNIYDMAGNVYDWTLEAYGSSNRYLRGGNYGGNGSFYPGSGRNNFSPGNNCTYYGFRAYFYIK